jgi:ribosomal protein L21E
MILKLMKKFLHKNFIDIHKQLSLFEDGDLVEVDANNGIVKLLK